MSDLSTLFPSPRTVTISGVEFRVREFVAGEFPLVAALGSRAIDFDAMGIGMLLETESDRVFALVASVTGRKVDEIKQLPISVLVDLIAAIVEENVDFFVRRLPTAVRQLQERMTGLTQSNASSAQATA
jgi:hypothetical protein